MWGRVREQHWLGEGSIDGYLVVTEPPLLPFRCCWLRVHLDREGLCLGRFHYFELGDGVYTSAHPSVCALYDVFHIFKLRIQPFNPRHQLLYLFILILYRLVDFHVLLLNFLLQRQMV